MATVSINVWGDRLTVRRADGQGWISPCNGQWHSSRTLALACELCHYLRSIGESVEGIDGPHITDHYDLIAE